MMRMVVLISFLLLEENLSAFYWVWCFCGLVIYGLYYIEIRSPLYLACWVFIVNGYWILSSAFLCPWRRSTIPIEKKCKKAKWLSGEALQISVKRREAKSKGEKERYRHLNAEFQRIARRDKKAFLSDQCKETEENNRMGKTRELFKKIRHRGNISCKDGLKRTEMVWT